MGSRELIETKRWLFPTSEGFLKGFLKGLWPVFWQELRVSCPLIWVPIRDVVFVPEALDGD